MLGTPFVRRPSGFALSSALSNLQLAAARFPIAPRGLQVYFISACLSARIRVTCAGACLCACSSDLQCAHVAEVFGCIVLMRGCGFCAIVPSALLFRRFIVRRRLYRNINILEFASCVHRWVGAGNVALAAV